GGAFSTAGGIPANNIAKWNGVTWSALSGPFGNGTTNTVEALAVYDDGGGPALYVGGEFAQAGGVSARYIAKWNGATWSAVSSPSNELNAGVLTLTVYDDGSGPALYAGGYFWAAGPIALNNVAKLIGTTWSPLGSGVY